MPGHYNTPEFELPPFGSAGNPTQFGAGGSGGLGFLQKLGGLPMGLNLGGQLLKFLGGAGARGRKRGIFKELGNLANIGQGQLGKEIFNVEDIFAQTRAGAEPDIQRFGRESDERFGFDQGRSGGEFLRMLADFTGKLRPKLATQEALARSRRDTSLLSTIGNLRQAQGAFV